MEEKKLQQAKQETLNNLAADFGGEIIQSPRRIASPITGRFDNQFIGIPAKINRRDVDQMLNILGRIVLPKIYLDVPSAEKIHRAGYRVVWNIKLERIK